MELKDYFDKAKGKGVLATADAGGKVGAALYARPYFMDDKTAVFIMSEHLTHENLKANPFAAYLFVEDGKGYSGKRLFLKKTKEEESDSLVTQICRKCDYSHYPTHTRHVVFFAVEKVLPLVGDH